MSILQLSYSIICISGSQEAVTLQIVIICLKSESFFYYIGFSHEVSGNAAEGVMVRFCPKGLAIP